MRKLLFVGLVAGGLLAAFALPASSQTPGDVDTFVTPEFVSISVTGGPVNYGSVPLSAADDTRSTMVGGPISVTNNGSVTVNLTIHGSDATSLVNGNTTWTLNCDSPNGVVAQDQFVHKFGNSSSTSFDFNSGGEVLCPSGAGAKSLASAIAPGGGPDFVLQIAMPTGSTGFAERSSQVIVTATQQ